MPESGMRQPRILIIGAGSRGNAYARFIALSNSASVASVAEPIPFKRRDLGRKYIWKEEQPEVHQEFTDWRQFLQYEEKRRKLAAAGAHVVDGVDAAFICTLDEQHAEIIIGLAPLELHILSEKPLATSLDDCLNIYASLLPKEPRSSPSKIFGIGHVLRYSPHNMLLRELLVEDEIVGEILSVEHTEPVGWWHFTHSYVRGNWRKESSTAPSLLTKSCHDIDFLLWILCSASSRHNFSPHLPSQLSSMGSLNQFRKSKKPASAGQATNCLSCPIETECMYSAKKIYVERHLEKGHTGWPVKIVNPEIEDIYRNKGPDSAIDTLLHTLSEDYDNGTPVYDVENRPWFGRCVWESDNDVCDNQIVNIAWEDDELPNTSGPDTASMNRGAKTASFHMIAHTEAQCERRGRVYGTKGEIEYDSKVIKVHHFPSGETEIHYPHQPGGGHGGGDDGLVTAFVNAVSAVMNEKMTAEQAQKEHMGCNLEDILRSHAVVFAAEQARKDRKVINWLQWWADNVEAPLNEPYTIRRRLYPEN